MYTHMHVCNLRVHGKSSRNVNLLLVYSLRHMNNHSYDTYNYLKFVGNCKEVI